MHAYPRIQRSLNAIAHPIVEYHVQKAKRDYRRVFPLCAACGIGPGLLRRANDVHHMTPVHVKPDLATSPTNLITLCRVHHFLVGHCSNWLLYHSRIGQACLLSLQAHQQAFSSRRDTEVAERAGL